MKEVIDPTIALKGLADEARRALDESGEDAWEVTEHLSTCLDAIVVSLHKKQVPTIDEFLDAFCAVALYIEFSRSCSGADSPIILDSTPKSLDASYSALDALSTMLRKGIFRYMSPAEAASRALSALYLLAKRARIEEPLDEMRRAVSRRQLAKISARLEARGAVSVPSPDYGYSEAACGDDEDAAGSIRRIADGLLKQAAEKEQRRREHVSAKIVSKLIDEELMPRIQQRVDEGKVVVNSDRTLGFSVEFVPGELADLLNAALLKIRDAKEKHSGDAIKLDSSIYGEKPCPCGCGLTCYQAYAVDSGVL